MVFCVQVSSGPSGYVTVYSGTKFYSDNSILTFTSNYQFDIAKATASQLEFNATNTVLGFVNNQFICNLANVTSDAIPKVIIITGTTKPTYILNVKNYSYSTDRTLFYGLLESKTVTMDFGANLDEAKIIQAPTITSTPSYSNRKLSFTITASLGETTTTIIDCGNLGKPNAVKVNEQNYNEGTVWTYGSTLILTWTHSSDATIEVSWLTSGLTSVLQSIRNNYYIVIGLVGLMPIMLVVFMLLLMWKGREEMDVKLLIVLILLCATLIIAAMLMINILNAFIGL